MAWWKTAKAGDKIVCISLPREVDGDAIVEAEQIGRVYTIRSIEPDDWFYTGVGIDVGLFNSCGGVVLTDAKHFRPVQPKSSETGVAALKRHLIGAPVKEQAE